MSFTKITSLGLDKMTSVNRVNSRELIPSSNIGSKLWAPNFFYQSYYSYDSIDPIRLSVYPVNDMGCATKL